MHLLEVGKPYHSSRSQWPETTQFNYRGGEAELALFLSKPTPAEVQGISKGKAEFALMVERGLIILLHQFHRAGLQPMTIGAQGTPTAMPWSESPFNWWRVPEAERHIPGDEPTEQTRQVLHVVLVDASSGLVLALRALTLSPEFTVALRNALRAQALGEPFDNEQKILDALYRRYPTSGAMVRDALARCVGGV